jgi:hypothetical protein
MGRPGAPEYIARALIALTVLFCVVNGAFMVIAPLKWYAATGLLPFSFPPSNPDVLFESKPKPVYLLKGKLLDMNTFCVPYGGVVR